MTVPVEWLISLISLVVVGIMAWIWHGFKSNSADHKELFITSTQTESKVDHLIHHHQGIPKYKDTE